MNSVIFQIKGGNPRIFRNSAQCNHHCNFSKSYNFGDNMILDVKMNIILFNRYSWSVMKRKPHFESKIKKFSIYKFFENFTFFIFLETYKGRDQITLMVYLIIISFTFRYILDIHENICKCM